MRPSFAERRHFLVFVLMAGSGLALTTVAVKSPERLTPVERVGLRIIGPLAGVGGRVSGLGRDAWTGWSASRSAAGELETARVEIRDLRVALLDRQELAAENERLRRLLVLQGSLVRRAIPARVVHRNRFPDGVLVIDRGADAGIAEDMPVISPDGVVGKILTVTPTQAKVQCVTDPDAGVAVLVGAGRDQVDAIVAAGDNGTCRLRHAGDLAGVAIGDPVVTSGLDQIYPKGLLVGTVASTGDTDAVERHVVVRTAVAFGRLEEVLVLAPGDAAAPPPRTAARVVAGAGGSP